MNAQTQISHQWLANDAQQAYRTGVSLHSHTSLSIETLAFVHDFCTQFPLVKPLFAHYERRTSRHRSIQLDFDRANWRPPLVPRMAYELESKQITDLGLEALVSITDHDAIEAPMLLRNLPEARGIPVSLEWTVPFGETAFHMGIHNLPSADGHEWMARMERYTASPDEATLHSMLAELHAIPQVLIVLNHPQWDLYKIGAGRHARELNRFMRLHNYFLHALELNGLRHARENRQVEVLAKRWRQLLISGGDRHGLEPNANINLTNATNFTEFVHEIRVERKSHVLYMEQYARPWGQRLFESTLEAISDHPHFSPGWQRWDERAFHADSDGTLRPIAELWTRGKAPLPLRCTIAAIRLLGHRNMTGALALAFSRAWQSTNTDYTDQARINTDLALAEPTSMRAQS